MNNLNEGVGKKIVEALKKQSELELSAQGSLSSISENDYVDNTVQNEFVEGGFLSDFTGLSDESGETSELSGLFTNTEDEDTLEEKGTYNDFIKSGERLPDPSAMPGNIIILKKLISQLPSGVTRHTGAQIIKQTMEALGISMKSVLTEAQEVQNNLKESSKECQMMIQEYKRKINSLEKQAQNYQKQYSALNDLISLFIQTGK